MMILVTSIGQVGSEAARLLVQRGELVRVLVRDGDKAAALAQAGVDVAEGDLEVPATIDAAMKGVSAVRPAPSNSLPSTVPRRSPDAHLSTAARRHH